FAVKVNAEDEKNQRRQQRSGAERSAVHDHIVKLAPAVNAEKEEEREDADQVEDALREHRPQRIDETHVSAPSQQGGTGHIARPDGQNGGEHVADGRGEERRIERWRAARVNQESPADGAKDERGEI